MAILLSFEWLTLWEGSSCIETSQRFQAFSQPIWVL